MYICMYMYIYIYPIYRVTLIWFYKLCITTAPSSPTSHGMIMIFGSKNHWTYQTLFLFCINDNVFNISYSMISKIWCMIYIYVLLICSWKYMYHCAPASHLISWVPVIQPQLMENMLLAGYHQLVTNIKAGFVPVKGLSNVFGIGGFNRWEWRTWDQNLTQEREKNTLKSLTVWCLSHPS